MNIRKYFILKNYIRFVQNRFPRAYKISYSQCGEDLLVDYIFTSFFHDEAPTYLDVGAHHPYKLSNTFLFYRKGSRGVCIEPDPSLWKLIKQKRPHDTCLNIGVGVGEKREADFYILDVKALNTFSKEEVEKTSSYTKIEKTIKVPLWNINDIIRTYSLGAPDFLSIDIEGLDEAVIKTLNFKLYRPKVICIETIENATEKRNTVIMDFLQNEGYMIYADTYINTIFVDRNLRTVWRK